MSPTLFRLGNIRVVIHTREHKPAHVHLIGPEAEAKIEIESWSILESHGFSAQALKKALEFLENHKDELLEAWKDIHE
jgi:uncharacterized protein (DUF885 family)